MSQSPRIVAIGGGHGLAATLAAAVPWAGSLTAVVSVADDGGSSGRLRAELGIPAPGDVRHCLEALSPDSPLRRAIGHRFADGELAGHPAGNVLLAALLAETADPIEAIDALAVALGARGRVLPATIGPVELVATTEHGEVEGQVAIARKGGIRSIGTRPADPPVPRAVLEAINAADLVVAGPGSLYTSVLAAAVSGIVDAIGKASAPFVYVANLAPEGSETAGYDVSDQIDALLAHGLTPDVVVVDSSVPVAESTGQVVQARMAIGRTDRHDPALLGTVLRDLVSAPSPGH